MTHFRRSLIVNADDFGQSPGVTRGIIVAHEQGIVTSASLMVRCLASAEAAAYGRAHPDLSLGLHFDFGEWAYRNEAWVKLYEVVPEDDVSAVAEEAWRQLETFRHLVGRDPLHLDSHQHVHLQSELAPTFSDIARQLSVPLRGVGPEVHYCGGFYGQTDEGWPLPDLISVQGLIKCLADLPPGVTELGCHPGYAEDLDSMYRSERVQEVTTLCDPAVRLAAATLGIHLCSFHHVTVEGRRPKQRWFGRRASGT